MAFKKKVETPKEETKTEEVRMTTVKEEPAKGKAEEHEFDVKDLKQDMLKVGHKLCDDLMKGKARDEKTSLSAIVEIYEAVKDSI